MKAWNYFIFVFGLVSALVLSACGKGEAQKSGDSALAQASSGCSAGVERSNVQDYLKNPNLFQTKPNDWTWMYGAWTALKPEAYKWPDKITISELKFFGHTAPVMFQHIASHELPASKVGQDADCRVYYEASQVALEECYPNSGFDCTLSPYLLIYKVKAENADSSIWSDEPICKNFVDEEYSKVTCQGVVYVYGLKPTANNTFELRSAFTPNQVWKFTK